MPKTEVAKPYKSYWNMDDRELADALRIWHENVAAASGWSSAYFAAKQVEAIVATAKRRGLDFVNNYPIKKG